MSGSNSEPKVHDASLHEAATNAANVAGAIQSKQPFVTDDAGGVVLVSTYAEIEEVIGSDACKDCDPKCEPCAEPVEVVEAPKKRRRTKAK